MFFSSFTNKPRLILFAIFSIALILRLVNLEKLPFNFHEDEVLVGYVGRYILQNGFDVYGNSWPLLYFNKFGDYYIILPMYFSGLATYLFGVNEFAVRFPAAFFGSLVVFPVYLFSLWTFRNTFVALISALFIAILPWHITLSRTSAEGIIGSTIFITAIVFLLYSIRKNDLRFAVGAILIFLLSYLIYHPFRVMSPLLVAGVVIIYWNVIKNKRLLGFIIISSLCFFLLTAYIGRTPWGSGRFNQTSIFSPLSGVAIRNQEFIYNLGSNDILAARMFHNKVVAYGREFLVQYFSHFSPVYLFMKGGVSIRLGVPEVGLLYISFAALLVAALGLHSKEKVDGRNVLLLSFLLLLSAFPSSLTYHESPNIHRSVFMSIPLVIFSAWGFYKIKQMKFGHYALVIIMCTMMIEGVYFFHQYSRQTDVYASEARNDGQKKVIEYVKDNMNKHDQILLASKGTMPLFYLFYTNDFNAKYAKQFKPDVRIDRIGKLTFIDEGCPSNWAYKHNITKNSLIIDDHTCTHKPFFTGVQKITGVNTLIPFTVLKLK